MFLSRITPSAFEANFRNKFHRTTNKKTDLNMSGACCRVGQELRRGWENHEFASLANFGFGLSERIGERAVNLRKSRLIARDSFTGFLSNKSFAA